MRRMWTIDLETTIRSPVGNKGSAFWPTNYVVYEGTLVEGGTCHCSKLDPSERVCFALYHDPEKTKTPGVVVGQNIKFDIHHYRWQGNKGFEKLLYDDKIIVWDTQIAEYLLTGQDHRFASLDDLAVKYGGSVKDDDVKALWDAGVDTPDIDEEMMREYLAGDLKNTTLVAKAQMEEAAKKDMIPLMSAQMDALLAIEEMEFNGMAVDQGLLDKMAVKIQHERDVLVEEVARELRTTRYGSSLDDIPDGVIQDALTSNQFLSAEIFGGTYTFKWRVPDGVFKTGAKKGQTKYRWEKKDVAFFGKPKFRRPEWETKKPGVYSVADDVLSAMAPYSWLADQIRHLRKLDKELKTYYLGLQELIYPDGLIHHELHQCSTKTGRLSSSKPNGQNLPSSEESEVKSAFVSRWGADGYILEADYKQLEVVALAFLSQDKTLLSDIRDGRDIHEMTGSRVFGSSMSKDQRRVTKTINFGLIYGGGVQTLSKQSGVDPTTVKMLIDAFYLRYPRVKEWQKEVHDKVVGAAVWEGDRTKHGAIAKVSRLPSITGRVYTFREQETMFRGRTQVNIKPSETKNYPVQGLATGDIVPTVLGKLVRVLKSNPRLKSKCLMINQVHDSVIFDCHKSALAEALHVIRSVMERAPEIMQEVYGIDFDLPLNVEISYGPNWKDQREFEKT